MAKDKDANNSSTARRRRSTSSSRSFSPSQSPPPPRPRRRDKDDPAPLDPDGDAKGGRKYNLSIPICKDFTRGRCSRSQMECRYAHPPSSVAVEGEKVTVCYDSLRDRCARGYACRYYHPPPHLRVRMQEATGIQPSPVTVGYQVNPMRPPDVLYGPPSLPPPPPLPMGDPSSQKTMTRPSIEVCRDFVRGRCARDAEECRYAHHTPTGGDGEYAIVCQDYLRGKCQRDACRYFHTPDHLRSRIKDLPVGSAPVAVDHGSRNSGLDGAYAYAGDPYEQQASKRMRIEDHRHRGSPGPYYGRGHGASLYPVSPLPPPPPLPPSHVVHPPPVLNDEDRLPVCRDFLRNKCSRDTSCRFVHPEPHTQVVDNYVTVCRDFLRGKCKREQCRFYHPPTKNASNQENGGSAVRKVSRSNSVENSENWENSAPSSPDL